MNQLGEYLDISEVNEMRRVENTDDLVPVNNVVITVFDKSNLDLLVPRLVRINPEVMIYSTGGTYKRLLEILGGDAERNVQEVSKYTGQPETEGGLVKTLHHKLFLGYLTETYCEAHQTDLEREGAKPIDMFVGNLYPFQKVVAGPEIDIEDARMNIDVGGPSALRAAAKNWHRVTTVADPSDYEALIKEIEEYDGCTTLKTRFELHKKVYRVLAEYNKAIADFVEGVPFKHVEGIYGISNRRNDHK